MRSREVQNSNGSGPRSRFILLKEVLSGKYPKRDVNKMNVLELEAFLLGLVEFTSVKSGAKTVATIHPTNKPKWWPSDVRIKKSLRNKESTKRFCGSLKQLIKNCSEFFRDYKQQWLPHYKSFANDENCESEGKGEKRKASDPYRNNLKNKKRKSLLHFKNEGNKGLSNISTPYVCIPSYKSIESPIDKPLNQAEFLGLFNLGLNNNEIPKETQVPNSSRLVKLLNCHHIPLSSDIGKAMIKKENYCVPEYVTARKLERLEWYVNKSDVKVSEHKFDISFDKSKSNTDHVYNFPKRQCHQMGANTLYNQYLFKMCKPFSVVLKNEELPTLKNHTNASKVRLNIPRLSGDQLKKYLCKEAKVVLNKKQINQNSTIAPKNTFLKEVRVLLTQNSSKKDLRSKRIGNR